MTKAKVIHTSGTRKKSVARLTLKPGKGLVRVNGVMLDHVEPRLARIKMQEPLLLVGDIASKVHIEANVYGGGIISQADAVRQAMGKALSEFGGDRIRRMLLDYDRSLLVADTRYKETRKPNDSKARAKKQKSYR